MTFSRFFGKLIVFLLPIVLAAVLLESNLRKIPNDYSYKRDQLLSKADSVELLIMGGSHTAYGINPAYLDRKSFNMAYVSQTMRLDNQVFKKFKDDLPNLNTLVLMMAYPTLSHKPNEGEESWRKFNYYRYYGIEPEREIYNHYLELVNVPFKRNFERIVKHVGGKKVITCDENGWFFNYYQENSVDLEKTAAKAAARHENGSMDFTRNVKLLKEILNICKEDGINVYMVSFPLYKEYIKHLNSEKFQKMVDTAEEMAENYSNVKYLNYSRDQRFTEADFYDADHLNDKGATKFTKIFNEETQMWE